MMTNTRTEYKRDPALEDFAAELTQAVYPIVVRPRPKGSWLDLGNENDGARRVELPAFLAFGAGAGDELPIG